MGQQTGLPLYIVGTSTFGANGGFIMPGFLMGVLQFGWLGVNAWGSSDALAKGFGAPGLYVPLVIVWTVLAAFVGLKGIQYVAKVPQSAFHADFAPIDPPLKVKVTGSLFFDGQNASGRAGPEFARASSAWQIDPVMAIESVAPCGCRSTHEPAVSVHQPAWRTVANTALPASCLSTVPRPTDESAPAGWRMT